jgi:hypothetical protein
MIHTGGARFEVELTKRIREEIERLKTNLAAGEAIKDYAQYQNYVGRLAALNLVIGEYYDDVQTTLNKD